MGKHRSSDIEKAKENKVAEGASIKWEGRSCTDVLCCLIFCVFLVGMIGITGYAFTQGDPLKVFTPFDSAGNLCGAGDRREYPFKFFTELVSKEMLEIDVSQDGVNYPTSLYYSVCVKQCPTEDPVPGSSDRLECVPNANVTQCPTKEKQYRSTTTTVTKQICVPDAEEYAQIFYSQIESLANNTPIGKYMDSIETTWKVVVGMAVASVAITILYIMLLRWITKPILYISLLIIFGLGVGGGFLAYQKSQDVKARYPLTYSENSDYQFAMAGAAIIWAFTLIYVACVCCNWSSIALGASIMECAGQFVSSNSRIVLLPISVYVICIPIFVWWVAGAIYLYTSGEAVPDNTSFIAAFEHRDETTYMFIYYLFGFFWLIAFCIAVEQFIIAAVTCMWYFSGQGSDDHQSQGSVSITLGVKWAMKYHLGSLAMGSFLVAVVQMIKVIFEYCVYQYEQAAGKYAENPVYKCLKCVIRCCIWCLDTCIKFINKNAYIQVALHNSNFCKGAMESFWLMLRNVDDFSMASAITGIMVFIGKGFIIFGNFFITLVIIGQVYPAVKQPYVPAGIVALVAYLVANLFLGIFDFAALAILHCYILEKDHGASIHTPDALKKFFDKKQANLVEQETSKANVMQ